MKKIIKSIIALALVVSMAFVTFGGSLDSAIKEKYALKDFLTTFEGVYSTKNCKTALECIEDNNGSGSYNGYYIVPFGEYPQDGVSDMVKQPIEWIVLEKSNSKALLISRYVLDCKPYINDNENMYLSNNPNAGWETSDLRKWLNNDFFNAAFNPNDKLKIIPYSLTGDNVFILNEAEMNAYFNLSKRDYRWNVEAHGLSLDYIEGNPWCATKKTNYAASKKIGKNVWLRDTSIKDVTSETSKYKGDKKLLVGYTTEDYMKNSSKILKGYINSKEVEGIRPCIWVTYDDSVKSDREQALEQLGGDVAKNIIGGVIDSALPGASLLIP